MTILIDRDTRVLVQGMTGRLGRFHAEDMIRYGTNVVGGVTPGKGGTSLLDRPQFDTVRQGRSRHRRRGQPRLRAAALRRRRHHGGRRRRHPALRLHHRRHPGAGHDARSSASCAATAPSARCG